jgi:uncharacterized protein
VQPAEEAGTYRGQMRVKIGPIAVAYEGSARFAEIDQANRATTLDVEGRDAKGQGSAAATIRIELTPQGPSTVVRVASDLTVTGRQAQFGRGIMEDVAARMLNDFAGRLEREILAGSIPDSGERPSAGEAGAETSGSIVVDGDPRPSGSTTSPRRQAPEVLDLGGMAGPRLARQAGGAAGVLVIGALAWKARRRRRELRFEIRWRF